MRKIFLVISLIFITWSSFAQDGTNAQETDQAAVQQSEKKKVYKGIEGGVLFNTGWAFVNFPEVGYSGGGVPLGVGGRGLAMLGDHFRAGGEGYMNTFKLDKNGSESRYAFGGAMGDFYWEFGPVLAYIGCTVGGGIMSNLYSEKAPESAWSKVEACYNNYFIWAACPYIGVQVKIAKKLSLIFHVGYTAPFGDAFNRFSCLNTCIGLEFGN